MNLQDLLAGSRGTLKNQKQTQFSGITTDSRKDAQGKIFFALKGDVHDGHQFLKQVVEKGVGAVVSHQWTPEFQALASQTTWIHVEDTLVALQTLANFWRRKWGKKILSVTGSNGKTSVKDFTATLLSGQFCVLKNEGSFNNHWGLPLTLLELKPEHDLAVVEMGMNHAGEITALCQIAEPNIVVVNNVGRAHIENFGSVDGIAKAKEEIYHGAARGAQALFNLADPRTTEMYSRLKNNFAQTFTFGTPSSELYFERVAIEVGGLRVRCRIGGEEQTLLLPLFGEQNVANLMTAASLALAAGTKPEVIFSQLPKCQTGWGRNQWVELASGARALFDGYNANPDSFAALLKNLGPLIKPQQKMIGVFSEMRELGTQAAQEHFDLGVAVAQSPIESCFFIGESATHFRTGFESIKNQKILVTLNTYEDSLALKIKSMLDSKTLVVIKGSRGGALERVLVKLDPKNFTTK